jgi:large subunit ribosomal protein L22
MEVKSTSKFVRLSPKKARDVAREIQGLPVSSALDILTFTPKKAAQLIGKTLKTAIADADNNFGLDTGTLVIKEAVIGCRSHPAPLQAPCQRLRRPDPAPLQPHFHHPRRLRPGEKEEGRPQDGRKKSEDKPAEEPSSAAPAESQA